MTPDEIKLWLEDYRTKPEEFVEMFRPLVEEQSENNDGFTQLTQLVDGITDQMLNETDPGKKMNYIICLSMIEQKLNSWKIAGVEELMDTIQDLMYPYEVPSCSSGTMAALPYLGTIAILPPTATSGSSSSSSSPTVATPSPTPSPDVTAVLWAPVSSGHKMRQQGVENPEKASLHAFTQFRPAPTRQPEPQSSGLLSFLGGLFGTGPDADNKGSKKTSAVDDGL